MKILQHLRSFSRSPSGATSIEYAVIAGIICLAVVGGATALGASANSSFQRVNSKVWGS